MKTANKACHPLPVLLSTALPLNISFSLFFLSSSSPAAALPVLPLRNFVYVGLCRSLDAASLRQSVNNTSVRGITAWEWFPFYSRKRKKLQRVIKGCASRAPCFVSGNLVL